MNENDNPSNENQTNKDNNESSQAPVRPPVRPLFERVSTHTAPRPTLPPLTRPPRHDPNLQNRNRDPHNEMHSTRRAANPNNRTRPPRKIAARNKRLAALYIFALVVVVAGCLTLFVLHLPDILDRAAQSDQLPAPTTAPQIVIPPNIQSLTAQIVRINPTTSAIEVVDINTSTRHDLLHTDGTQMTNIQGNEMVFAQLAVGQLVEINFDANDNRLIAAHQSRNAWERRNQTNLRIDLEYDTITAGNMEFTFNHHQTLVLYRGQPFPIAHVQPSHTVTLLGYGDHVWLIQLDAGHGFLQLLNTDRVVNGSVEVGFDFHPLVGIEPIQLQEGEHTVIVRGINIEQFVQTITIRHGETFSLNLNETVLRTGILNVNVVPDNASIFVNGDLAMGLIELDFGEHLIRVEANGYVPQEQLININDAINIVSFDLEPAIRTGMLRVTTVPTNAQIFVNNQLIGFSELHHELPLGHYSVIARLAGHDESALIVVEVVPDGTDVTIILIPTQVAPWPPALPPYDQPAPPLPPG